MDVGGEVVWDKARLVGVKFEIMFKLLRFRSRFGSLSSARQHWDSFDFENQIGSDRIIAQFEAMFALVKSRNRICSIGSDHSTIFEQTKRLRAKGGRRSRSVGDCSPTRPYCRARFLIAYDEVRKWVQVREFAPNIPSFSHLNSIRFGALSTVSNVISNLRMPRRGSRTN